MSAAAADTVFGADGSTYFTHCATQTQTQTRLQSLDASYALLGKS